MTTTVQHTTTAGTASTPTIGSLLLNGVAATAVAAAATAAVAAAGAAAGISLDVSGEPIPVSGFAVLTTIFSLVGVVLATALRRFARHPRRAFVRKSRCSLRRVP